MRLLKHKILLLILSVVISCSDDKIIELPITMQDGYGPFWMGFGAIHAYSEIEGGRESTQLEVSGLPEKWVDVKVGEIVTHQSDRAIKNRIAFAYENGPNGELKMIVDANNNYDFSDDAIFYPPKINGSMFQMNKDSLLKSNAIDVSFERIINNKITDISAPLLIVHMPKYNQLLYNFAQFAQASLDGTEIAIESNNFMDLSFKDIHLTKKNLSISQDQDAYMSNFIANNEYLEIGDNIYKNLGIHIKEYTLVLEKIDRAKEKINSTQIGFKAIEFTGKKHKTENFISLNSIKGKYVLLDFWATTCAPCIKEFPHLKKMYSEMDTTQFEILGIAGNSSIEQIDYIIDKHQITWPQIVSDDINKINEKYGIKSYPQTILLDPEGIIISKGLRGKQLEVKIKSVIK